MSGDINNGIVSGRLVRDPELKSTNNGKVFCRFTIASNKVRYNKDTRDKTETAGFYECVAWGKLAEVIGDHLKKGAKVAVEYSLDFQSWTDAEQKKRSKVELNVTQIHFLSAKQGGESGAGNAPQNDGPPAGSLSDDDIPW